MNHYVLFYVEGYNGDQAQAEPVLHGFEGLLDKLAAESGTIKRLGAHSILSQRGNDVGILGRVIAAAEGAHLKYQVRYLDEN